MRVQGDRSCAVKGFSKRDASAKERQGEKGENGEGEFRPSRATGRRSKSSRARNREVRMREPVAAKRAETPERTDPSQVVKSGNREHGGGGL